MQKQRLKVGILSCSVALAVVAGCAPAAPVTQAVEGTIGANKGGTVVVTTPGTANTVVNETGAALDLPKVEAPNAVPPEDSGDQPVDKVKGQFISAKEGGRYVSEDGSLTAVFPPGALSQDAEVRFLPMDTSKEKNTNQKVNGIRFQADLGDAYIQPGQAVTIESKADERMVGELKAMYSNFTPEKFSLVQNTKGDWAVAMKMEGPALAPLTEDQLTNVVDPYATNRDGIMQEGFNPLPNKKGSGFKKDSRIEAFCNYYPPPPPKTPRQICAEVTWQSDDKVNLDGKAAFGGISGVDNSNVYVRFGRTGSATVTGINGYWVKELVPGKPGVTEQSHNETIPNPACEDKKDDVQSIGAPPSKEVAACSPATITNKIIDRAAQAAVPDTFVDKFVSGWIDLSGGSNVDVRAGYNWNGGCYCAWTVYYDDIVFYTAPQPTNSAGRADNVAREGFNIGVQAYTVFPNPTSSLYAGAGVGTTANINPSASSVSNCAKLKVPKYSPQIKLNLTSASDSPMKGSLKVELVLDGSDNRSFPFNASGTSNESFNFFVTVANDAVHKMAIKQILLDDFSLAADQNVLKNFQAKDIQRNGVYPISIGMVLNQPK